MQTEAPINLGQHHQVAMVGDLHGNGRWASHVNKAAAARGVSLLLQVGDLGVGPWPGESRSARRPFGGFIRGLDDDLGQRGQRMIVTIGNHENFDALDDAPRDDAGMIIIGEHIRVLPRPARFTIGGPPSGTEDRLGSTASGPGSSVIRSFGSLGGAPSVDLFHRKVGKSWWMQEQITEEHVAAVRADVRANHSVDVMLSHDAPALTPAVSRIVDATPNPWPPEVVQYAERGRSLLSEAFHAWRPTVAFHGHYHVRDTAEVHGGVTGRPFETPQGEPFTCRVESLAMDGVLGNAVLLDINTLDVSPLV
ncbi:MAG: hypothetical protein LBH13_03320 [Cellulomonadaceae bacterium]|jgi:hypothetical protein|nr:hypothetical protein [Cellulomonadaceae bacterium]